MRRSRLCGTVTRRPGFRVEPPWWVRGVGIYVRGRKREIYIRVVDLLGRVGSGLRFFLRGIVLQTRR